MQKVDLSLKMKEAEVLMRAQVVEKAQQSEVK